MSSKEIINPVTKYYPYVKLKNRCVIPGCPSKYYSISDKATECDFKNIRFFSVPSNIERRKQWIEIIKKETGLELTFKQCQYKYICERHFQNRFHCFSGRLAPHGYPSLFPLELPENDTNNKNPQQENSSKKLCETNNKYPHPENSSKKLCETNNKNPHQEHSSKKLCETNNKNPHQENSSKKLCEVNKKCVSNDIFSLLTKVNATNTKRNDEYLYLEVVDSFEEDIEAENGQDSGQDTFPSHIENEENSRRNFNMGNKSNDKDEYFVLELPSPSTLNSTMRSHYANVDPHLEHNYFINLESYSERNDLDNLDNDGMSVSSHTSFEKEICVDKFANLRKSKKEKSKQKARILKKKLKTKLLKMKIDLSVLKNRKRNINILSKNQIFNLSNSTKIRGCFKDIRKSLVMPYGSSLESLLHNIPLYSGINFPYFTRLAKTAKKMKKSNKTCVLLFGTMPLTSQLEYCKEIDKIIGYEHFSNSKVATQALVFMIQGLEKSWKQPVGYYFVRTLTVDQLSNLITDMVSMVNSVGFTIMGTICDHSPINRVVVSKLQEKCSKTYMAKPYFILDDQRIFTMYDSSSLLVSTRNALLDYKIQYKPQKCARFSDIVDTFNADKKRNFSMLPKLRQKDISLGKGRSALKQNVTIAARTFSYSVASCMDPDHENTAKFISQMDLLFDMLNSRNGSKKNIFFLLKKMIGFIQRWVFLNKKNGNVEDMFLRDAWLTTLKATKMLIRTYRVKWIKYPRMKSINLDPLRNLFASIYYFGSGNKRRPTPYEFSEAFKLSVLNNLILPTNAKSNCKKDQGRLLDNYQDLFTPPIHQNLTNKYEDVDVIFGCIPDQMLDVSDVNKEFHIITEVSSYLIKKQKLKCEFCKTSIIIDSLLFDRLKGNKKKIPFLVSRDFTLFVTNVFHVGTYVLSKFGHVSNVRAMLKTHLKKNINFEWFKCETHKDVIKDKMLDLSVFVLIKNKVKSSVKS